MRELRKDYVLDRWVLIADVRSMRPRQFKEEKTIVKEEKCFFCPGNESQTPPEIGRIPTDKPKDKGWKMRWFANKFPAVLPEGQHDIKTDNTFFTFSSGFGYHEVIVETNTHNQLWDLRKEDIKQLFKIYNERIEDLSKRPGVSYVNVFKNHGEKAGTSIVHSHSQIIATNTIPEIVKEKVKKGTHLGRCLYCQILNIEKNSDRRCFENNSFVAFTPYASRFNFEIWVLPKRHARTLAELRDNELEDLADIMKKILTKLKELNVSFNYYLHYAPKNQELHFQIEICPRIAVWAGFEYCSEIIINSLPPENAAKFYRDEK
ncbi:galactose-1-phosphate uridylyltransferase [Candidatus Woesearchaeota archaeon]|nr:MAG: galactose-1-phosphate uridylyltransferase [Candidatus Woesearchaeota archaeon]